MGRNVGCRVRERTGKKLAPQKFYMITLNVLENYLWGLGRERIDQKWGKDFGGHYSGMVERELKTEW